MSKSPQMDTRIKRILKHYPEQFVNFLKKYERRLEVDLMETPLWNSLFKSIFEFQQNVLTKESCEKVHAAFAPVINLVLEKGTEKNDAFFTMLVMAVCNRIELDFDPQNRDNYKDDPDRKKIAHVYFDILDLFYASKRYHFDNFNFRSDKCFFYYQDLLKISEDTDYQKRIEHYWQKLF